VTPNPVISSMNEDYVEITSSDEEVGELKDALLLDDTETMESLKKKMKTSARDTERLRKI